MKIQNSGNSKCHRITRFSEIGPLSSLLCNWHFRLNFELSFTWSTKTNIKNSPEINWLHWCWRWMLDTKLCWWQFWDVGDKWRHQYQDLGTNIKYQSTKSHSGIKSMTKNYLWDQINYVSLISVVADFADCCSEE